jgi:hypothetical protein
VAYTSWAYWVFRKRVSSDEFDLDTKNPIDLMRGGAPPAPSDAQSPAG